MKKNELLQQVVDAILALLKNSAPNSVNDQQAASKRENKSTADQGITFGKASLVKDGDPSTVKHSMTATQGNVTITVTISHDLDATRKWANPNMSLDEAQKINPKATADDLKDYKASTEKTLDDFSNGKISHTEMRNQIHGAKMKLYNMEPKNAKQMASEPKPSVDVDVKNDNKPDMQPGKSIEEPKPGMKTDIKDDKKPDVQPSARAESLASNSAANKAETQALPELK
ncbi:MAG: hypothetical protein P1U40_04415 [Coxiellaceae bacterium]|nr:hypothetical protein [Coxiellaceae bacterium]